MNSKRRVLLKGTLAAGTMGVAVGAGVLTPRNVLAEAREAFQEGSMDEILKSALGSDRHEAGHVRVEAPNIAENGAVVPVSVESDLDGVTEIAILAAANSTPLTSRYELGEGTRPKISTRIKMGETSDVVAVVKTGDGLYSGRKEVKVTVGGCGG
ncbi:thiosulfate oxidation carrier protein SoxY [Ectothiorhodospira mobilis]|uniref:thiosulfate oxidation carrier protein SoxY n=1 Tax=Ectothiorhodospira mobilis TaxID=195064 RepID=UPI001EE89113|nr:thiosulfate oxidation carrier protein SoxY [Ectothiorhodospira mobilis]MCG5535301.1 thiosulfate oxidation carrier protein SoxY [Ectothiorhodospira mobilis]